MLFSRSYSLGKRNLGVSCKARFMCAWATKEVGEQEKDFRTNPFVCGETDASCHPLFLAPCAPLRDLLSESLPAWRWGRDQQCSFAWRVPDSPCKQSVNSQTHLTPDHLFLNIVLPSLKQRFLCLTYSWGNWGTGSLWYLRFTQQLCRAQGLIQTILLVTPKLHPQYNFPDFLRDNLCSCSCPKVDQNYFSLTYIHYPFFGLLCSLCHSLLGLFCSSHHTFFGNGETFLKDIHSCCLLGYYLGWSEWGSKSSKKHLEAGTARCSLTLGSYSAALAGSAFALPPVLDEGSVAKLTALAGSYWWSVLQCSQCPCAADTEILMIQICLGTFKKGGGEEDDDSSR